MCGIMRPTNPIVPTNATAEAVMNAERINKIFFTPSTFMPSVCADSSPSSSAFRSFAKM